MPFYDDLRPEADFEDKDYLRVFPDLQDDARIRTIDGVLALKQALQGEVRPRQTESNLLIASWNIKEFGHTTQRLPEAYFYIAEILSAFDLIAVQEIKTTLKDLEIVMRLLGPDWRYMINDITEGTDGNAERSGYIFNTRRVKLSGLAGEIALWPELTDDSPLGLRQLKRAPYLTGFIAGWKKFAMVNLHLHPGDDADDVAFRKEEMRLLLKAIESKRERLWTQNLVLVGDMNLYKRDDDETIALVTDSGYTESTALAGKVTNVTGTQAYDRMFFAQNEFFRLAHDATGAEEGGVFNPFEHVFDLVAADAYTDEMVAVYGGSRDIANDPSARASYFKHHWRKNQLSDHLPIWVELHIDDSAPFLRAKRKILAAGGPGV